MTETVTETAARLNRIAHAGPIGKKQTAFALYSLLGECYALAERCEADASAREELYALFKAQRDNNPRRWVEADNDAFGLVCRYVFPGGSRSAERANASRYAVTLREAKRRGIGPAAIVAFLTNDGGINALYQARVKERQSVTTKTLWLKESIEVPAGKAFTVTLRRTPQNAFEVLAFKIEEEQA